MMLLSPTHRILHYPENNSAIISLTSEELNRLNFKKGDTEGLINFALAIKGITFAIFIAEKDGITKLSLRSKGDIDVSEIAKKYFEIAGRLASLTTTKTQACKSEILKKL